MSTYNVYYHFEVNTGLKAISKCFSYLPSVLSFVTLVNQTRWHSLPVILLLFYFSTVAFVFHVQKDLFYK